ncbi:putative diacylglycerol O-acyltransferase tgs1 [Folsomia candida]|uniref:Putative diacylglycerol O-acyltransferase tgs1 n=1 Tax=Folsomia candida TaxID=158441 RepID=A0A226F1C8_FOLCA|nr:putative diacylglycerol O-acyltransferase tgs1 [Folsomia candida]
MTSLKVFLSKHKFFLLISSIFLAYFILPPFLILVAAPLYIYKRIIVFFSKWKRRLCAPFSAEDCLHISDDIHGRPRSSMAGVVYLKGSYSFEELVTRVEKVASERPKLTCTITRVYFWKKCDDFQISNHVNLNEESDPANLSQVFVDLLQKSYPIGKPLWEIVSLPNYAHVEYGTSSAVGIRMHHTVGDGLALLSLVRTLCDKDAALDEEMNRLLKAVRKKNKLNGFNSQSIPHDSNQDVNIRSDGIIAVSTLIDLALLKRISKQIRAKVTSVIHAGVAGAVRRTILERGGDPIGDFAAIYAFPKLNHPGILSNNILKTSLQLLVHKMSTPTEKEEIENIPIKNEALSALPKAIENQRKPKKTFIRLANHVAVAFKSMLSKEHTKENIEKAKVGFKKFPQTQSNWEPQRSILKFGKALSADLRQ